MEKIIISKFYVKSPKLPEALLISPANNNLS